MNNILIKDAIIIPMHEMSGDRYFHGYVGIEDNIIALVSSDSRECEAFRLKHKGDLTEIDGQDMLLMPGLINTHCHVPMTLMRSYADDIPLMPWLKEYIWPFEAEISSDDISLGARLGIAEMLLGGTTCFVDMYFHEKEIARDVENAGIRAVLSPTLIQSNRESFEQDFYDLLSQYPSDSGRLVSLMIAPHSPYTCSKDDLVYVRQLADRYGLGLHIHLAETISEIDIIRKNAGTSPVRYLDTLGLLTPSTLAVHCVHVDKEDIELMRTRGVSVSHNPQSNMKLASGIAPVARMAAEGINITIGTDGTASNNDLDMWEEMRSASFLQKVAESDACIMPAWDILKMVTVNAAKAVGLHGKVGEIRKGMLADMIMIDMRKPHFNPRNDIISNLVYCAKSADVDTVIVNGKMVVRNRILQGVDLSSLYRSIDQRVEQIREKLKDKKSE